MCVAEPDNRSNVEIGILIPTLVVHEGKRRGCGLEYVAIGG